MKIYVIICIFLIAIGCKVNRENVFVDQDIEENFNTDALLDYTYIDKKDGNTIYRKNEKFSVINNSDVVIIQPMSLDTMYFRKGFIIIKDRGKFGLYDQLGQMRLPAKFQRIENYGPYFSITMENIGVGGYIIESGQIIEPKYCKFSHLDENVYLVSTDCKTSGFLNLNDFYSDIEFKYEAITSPYKGEYVVKYQENWGVVDKNNNVILPFLYSEIRRFRGLEIYKVKKDNKYGLVTNNNRFIAEIEYSSIDLSCSHSVMIASNYNKSYFINKSGLIPIGEFQSIRSICRGDNEYIVKLNGKYGVLSSSLQTKFDPQFEDITPNISNTYPHVIESYLVKDDYRKWGLIDSIGNTIMDYVFENVESMRDGIEVSYQNNDFKIDNLGRCIENCPVNEILKELNMERL